MKKYLAVMLVVAMSTAACAKPAHEAYIDEYGHGGVAIMQVSDGSDYPPLIEIALNTRAERFRSTRAQCSVSGSSSRMARLRANLWTNLAVRIRTIRWCTGPTHSRRPPARHGPRVRSKFQIGNHCSGVSPNSMKRSLAGGPWGLAGTTTLPRQSRPGFRRNPSPGTVCTSPSDFATRRHTIRVAIGTRRLVGG